MKAESTILLSILFFVITLTLSCKKESKPVLPNVGDKMSAYDPLAFVGIWETYKIDTIDSDDSIKPSSDERLQLIITETHWITENQSIPYTIEYENVCQFIFTHLYLDINGQETQRLFFPSGEGTEVKFSTYEYFPNDPILFRIDKSYRLIGG